MILIDSIFVQMGGAKVLLDYLIKNIENEKIDCFYLFDERCKDDYGFIPKERKLFLKASLLKRHIFYKENKLIFYKVLCFGNIPPTLKLNFPVITYFHQTLFLNIPDSVSFFIKMKIKLKTSILSFIKSNTDTWLVQSDFIRNRLASKFKINLADVKLMPFYPPLKNEIKNYKRRTDGFAYISQGGLHKNHSNLIEAFCSYFDEYKKGTLSITISNEFPELIEMIKIKNSLGYPIINYGIVKRDDLVEIYQTNKYLIFPSLGESFGLGLVEAIENGCNVIGSDLPYTYAVCNPSIVFNPLDIHDITRALATSQLDNVKETEQLVFNKIDDLILLLKGETTLQI